MEQMATILNNRYMLGQQIAQGQICTVYMGTDQVLHRKVAIKVVPPTHLDAYRLAVRNAARLSHAHIVGLFDVHSEGDELYLIQEYIDGQSFNELLRTSLPPETIVEIGEHLAQALAYAHRHQVIHGDLTPQAVFLNRSGNVKLNNFGLPPDTAYFQAMETVLATMTGSLPTPARATVEPAESEDVRAAGFLLYQLAMPRPGANGAPSAPPPTLLEIIARATERYHPQRITSAEELSAALQACRAELETAQISEMATANLNFTQAHPPITVPRLQLPQRDPASTAMRAIAIQPEASRSMTALSHVLPVLLIGLILFAIFFGIGYYLPFGR